MKRPKTSNTDRRLLVLLTSRLGTWRDALLLVKPETLLQWHRDLLKLVWRHQSAKVGRPSLSPEVITLIKLLIFSQRHLSRLIKAYVAYFNHDRPHQGLRQRLPFPIVPTALPSGTQPI